MRKILFSVFILAWICVTARSQNTDLKSLIDTGHYTEAEALARKQQAHHQLAEVFALTGRYPEAIAEFEQAAKNSNPKEALASDLRRAELLELTGHETDANAIYASFIKYYRDNNPHSAYELTLIARALVHLERFQDANDMFREAIEADSNYLEAQLAAGELFTQKYNYSDAAQFLADALKLGDRKSVV